MSDDSQSIGVPFIALKKLLRPKAPQEMCDFCGTALRGDHRHLLEVEKRNVRCVCDPCALRFEDVVGGRFKIIPRNAVVLRDFRLSDEQWNAFALPINLAFFYRNGLTSKVIAMYPGPGGAMESLLTFRDWEALMVENPRLRRMRDDTEALLINRIGDMRDYFIAPIDACYELTGLVRKHWRGLSGSEAVWKEITRFFDSLRERAVEPVHEDGAYARA